MYIYNFGFIWTCFSEVVVSSGFFVDSDGVYFVGAFSGLQVFITLQSCNKLIANKFFKDIYMFLE